jgi:hypothetical protein
MDSRASSSDRQPMRGRGKRCACNRLVRFSTLPPRRYCMAGAVSVPRSHRLERTAARPADGTSGGRIDAAWLGGLRRCKHAHHRADRSGSKTDAATATRCGRRAGSLATPERWALMTESHRRARAQYEIWPAWLDPPRHCAYRGYKPDHTPSNAIVLA